jgi:hypothetical protein
MHSSAKSSIYAGFINLLKGATRAAEPEGQGDEVNILRQQILFSAHKVV